MYTQGGGRRHIYPGGGRRHIYPGGGEREACWVWYGRPAGCGTGGMLGVYEVILVIPGYSLLFPLILTGFDLFSPLFLPVLPVISPCFTLLRTLKGGSGP